MKEKIAVFVNDLFTIFLIHSHANADYEIYFLVSENEPNADWIQKLADESRILKYRKSTSEPFFLESSIYEALQKSDLSRLLRAKKISYIYTSEPITQSLSKLVKKCGLKLVACEDHIYAKFENKIWFDKFMKKNHLPHPKGKAINLLNEIDFSGKKHVLQKPVSWGSEGTFIISGKNELDYLISNKVIHEGEELLSREYVGGTSYGISVFITPASLHISSLRMQCFDKSDKDSRSLLIGLQWVTVRDLRTHTVAQINKVFTEIGRLFQAMDFFGHVNFDFIVDREGNLFVIECNSRFSAGATSLFWNPGLIHDIDMYKLLFDSFFQKELKNEMCGLPNSGYNGSYICYDYYQSAGKKATIEEIIKNGLYEYVKDSFIYRSPDYGISQGDKFLLFFSEAADGMKLREDTTAGYLYSNFPLFDAYGTLTSVGLKVRRYFNPICIQT